MKAKIDEDKLLPCPFCGDNKHYQAGYYGQPAGSVFIKCRCGATMIIKGEPLSTSTNGINFPITLEKAIEAWNTRPHKGGNS